MQCNLFSFYFCYFNLFHNLYVINYKQQYILTMRRVTKKALTFIFGIFTIILYCEFLIYYVVIAQCTWPNLENLRNSNILNALVIADTHLLGPYRGHWLDKWRREWQMKRAFQAIIAIHKPDAVFVLGDLFDEGEWTNDLQFKNYVDRFHQLFYVPDNIKMYVAVGNHDIGFHNRIRRGHGERFERVFNASSVQHVTLKDNHFVIINSMALHGDGCNLCESARKSINKLTVKFKCSGGSSDGNNKSLSTCTHPILMQHFPLYRISDAQCSEPDAPPLPQRNKLFRTKIDSLSREATDYVVKMIKPRAAFGGHTHHGCLVQHTYEKFNKIKFLEYSVPSFSWRNRPDPKYMLLSVTPTEYAVNKCGLPTELTIALSAVILIFLLLVFLFRMRKIRRIM